MNTSLTIVIPAKNEAKLIPRLLESLVKQDYSKMSSTKVLVADARSTDGTPDIVMSFRNCLNVEVIAGGMPSVGRNCGAARAVTPYILFLDADIELASSSLIRRVIERAERDALQCVTTNILCSDCSVFDKVMYGTNNFFQYLSKLHRPFVTGMFMLVETKTFRELGGFHEQVHFAEDYLLSSQTNRRKFAIVRGGVYTTNRRFEKMGHFRVARLFLATAFNFWNKDYFLRDHKYWA